MCLGYRMEGPLALYNTNNVSTPYITEGESRLPRPQEISACYIAGDKHTVVIVTLHAVVRTWQGKPVRIPNDYY